MKLSLLSESLSLNRQRVHEWTSAGIVLPIEPAMGRGKHSEYDDASLVAAAVAQELETLFVVARRYAEAFAKLHILLRGRSSLEWSQMFLDLTPTEATLVDNESAYASQRAVVRIDLSKVCSGLHINQQQKPLNFGLQSA